MDPYIVNLNTNSVMDPSVFFGKDANRLLANCKEAYQNWLRGIDGCYRSPSRPSRMDFASAAEFNSAKQAWKESHPEENAKEQRSLAEQEDAVRKPFLAIYGIARRHGLYLHWHGTDVGSSTGDQWTIYSNHKAVARICCI